MCCPSNDHHFENQQVITLPFSFSVTTLYFGLSMKSVAAGYLKKPCEMNSAMRRDSASAMQPSIAQPIPDVAAVDLGFRAT